MADVRLKTSRMPWRTCASSARRMPLAAFVLAGAVALGGCSGEEARDPGPSVISGASTASGSPSASVTPSPSVTESGPAIPAAARVQTEAGAIAYARFFFDQLNVAWMEPRVGLIKALGDAKCQFCANTEETAAFLVKAGERYKSAPLEVLDVEPFVGAPEGQQYLVFSIEQKPAQIVDSGGIVVDTETRLVDDSYVALLWADGRWFVLDVEKTA